MFIMPVKWREGEHLCTFTQNVNLCKLQIMCNVVNDRLVEMITAKVVIFAQYIFPRISRSAVDAQK